MRTALIRLYAPPRVVQEDLVSSAFSGDLISTTLRPGMQTVAKGERNTFPGI